jgi:thioredoxin reductase
MSTEFVDAAIVGAGTAGLSAALWLGRYERSAIIFDTGQPRNEPAWAVHGYPGLQDPLPSELRRRLEQQALGTGARIRTAEVVRVEGTRDDFTVHTRHNGAVRARRVDARVRPPRLRPGHRRPCGPLRHVRLPLPRL